MKRTILNTPLAVTLAILALTTIARVASALSLSLPEPAIYFPANYDTNRAAQILKVLKSDQFKYLDGLTSYWPPDWSTTLVYDGDAKALRAFLAALGKLKGISVKLTFSADLSKETGSAPRAGSWWVRYSHTSPDTLVVRVNLAADSLGKEKFGLSLPR